MMSRIPLIAGNWKMHKSRDELRKFVSDFNNCPAIQERRDHATDIWIAVPYTLIETASTLCADMPVTVGAQNVHFAKQGAFTGELSLSMIKEVGAGFSLIGHSERRQFFAETDEVVTKKVATCQASGFVTIACLGETLAERESGETITVCDRQLAAILSVVTRPEFLVLAYEPVWAIGTGKTATAEEAQDVHAHIRNRLIERFGEDVGSSVRILYGGSVKPANIEMLLAQKDVDGALVGGASLAAEDFSALVVAGYQEGP